MNCPFCSHEDTRVVDSRLTRDGMQIRRRRQCESCGSRFNTFETPELKAPRIIKSDGRCVMLAIDHGYFLGPLSRLEKPGETVEPLLPYADALMLTRGVLRQCIPQGTDMPGRPARLTPIV